MQHQAPSPPCPPLVRQRHRWFVTEMTKRRSAYTFDKRLKLFTGTWNVNGSSPDPSANIRLWLSPTPDVRFDVYMLAFQEVQALTGVDAIRTDANRGVAWRNVIEKVLGSDYELVAERQLVGILVLVFLRRNHTPYLSNVQLSYAATGWLNAGNKGGVAARFQLYDQTIACVACHLAAHTEFVDRRNQDFRDVVRKAVFLPDQGGDEPQNSAPALGRHSPVQSDVSLQRRASTFIERTSSMGNRPNSNGNGGAAGGPGQWLASAAGMAVSAISDMKEGANTAVLNHPNAIKILEHDVVFWLGDLNYRIDAPLDNVMEWIETRNWNELYQADQLQKQMRTCEVFDGFQEGPIRFAPTYKHNRFKDGYKCGENGEQTRVPAYTDRILWRLGDGKVAKPRLDLREYSSALVYSSDHRPVYASFDMVFGVEDVGKRRDVESHVNHELDKREATLRPVIRFSPSQVDFGDVFFEQQLKRSITIRNSGNTTAYITIRSAPDEPKWLIFDASKWRCVEIEPEKSLQLSVAAFITPKNGSAADVSRNGCILDAVLPVTIEPGSKLQNIPVRGKYVATTLGLSLETLSMLDKPVLALRESDFTSGNLQQKPKSPRSAEQERTREPGVVPLSIPKEIWVLVNALMSSSDGVDSSIISEPRLFLQAAEATETQRVLSLVDRGERIPTSISRHAVAQCMLTILRHLDDSVIPRALHRRVVEAGQTEEIDHVNGVIELLPPLNQNVFWYLIGMLCESLVFKNDPWQVAAVFGDALLASGDKDKRYKTAFVHSALRYQQEGRQAPYRAAFDLSTPATHPKRTVIESINR